jgi:SAM-dependent methyltransferase
MDPGGHAAAAFDAFEAAGWEEQAATYHRFFAPITSRVAGELLDASDVRTSSRVLDVATGPGYLAAQCAERGARPVGVDIAHQMVALARRLYPGIEFRHADAQRLPFADESFDAVTGNFAILHFASPERAAEEFARVLVPGGRLALSTWGPPDSCRLAGVFADAVAEIAAPPPADVPPGPPFFRFASEPELSALLAGAGLVDIAIRTSAFVHHQPSAQALWDGLLGATVRTRAVVLGQPEPVRRRIRAAFDRLVGEYRADDGLGIPVTVKIASARKPAT